MSDKIKFVVWVAVIALVVVVVVSRVAAVRNLVMGTPAAPAA